MSWSPNLEGQDYIPRFFSETNSSSGGGLNSGSNDITVTLLEGR